MRFPGSASAVARVFTPWRGAPTAPSRSAWHPVIAILAVALVLAGCGVRLAPNYDRSIIDGLGRANEETMTLFATVASGVPKNTFPARSQTYDELIGKFDALRLEAQVRPSPQTPAAATLIFGNNPQAQQQIANATTAPTPDILATIIRTITMMRETDRKQGLVPIVVQGFKQEFIISMQQVLTYEKALDR